MRNRAIAIGLMLAVLGAAAVQATEIYKWVDEEGNVHFGDRPDGEDVEQLKIESRPTDPARVQAESQAVLQGRARAAAAKAEAAAEQPTAEQQREEAAEREKKCTAYKTQLQSYVNNRRLYRMGNDGEREYLSDEEINQTRELAAKRVEEFCN